MAGRRKAKGRPPRQAPGVRARSRLASASTAEQQFAAACDLFRVTAKGNAQLMRRAAETLIGLSNGGAQ